MKFYNLYLFHDLEYIVLQYVPSFSILISVLHSNENMKLITPCDMKYLSLMPLQKMEKRENWRTHCLPSKNISAPRSLRLLFNEIRKHHDEYECQDQLQYPLHPQRLKNTQWRTTKDTSVVSSIYDDVIKLRTQWKNKRNIYHIIAYFRLSIILSTIFVTLRNTTAIRSKLVFEIHLWFLKATAKYYWKENHRVNQQHSKKW